MKDVIRRIDSIRLTIGNVLRKVGSRRLPVSSRQTAVGSERKTIGNRQITVGNIWPICSRQRTICKEKNSFTLCSLLYALCSLNFALYPSRFTPCSEFIPIKSGLYTLCLIFFGIVTQTNSQTVDSLVNEALKNNPQMKALEYRINSAEYRAESVNALPAPSLGIEFSQVPVSKVDIFNGAISNSLSLSQMFPIGGKVNAMTEVERKNVVVEKDNLNDFKTRLIAGVKMSYFNLWQIERKIDIQKKNIELLEDLIKSTTMLYVVNRINQADILTVKSEIASNGTQLLSLKRDLETEIYKLNQLLGRDLSSKTIRTVSELPGDSLKISPEELETKLAEVNPQLQRMESMIDMNKAMITANRKELIPDLMIQGMIMRMPQGMILTSKTDLGMLAMEAPKTEYMYSLMASINLPFAPWSVKKFTAKEDELASGIRSIEYEKINMQREMISDLKKIISKLQTSKDQITLYTNNVIPLYRQAAEAQISSYQNGRTSINTVIDSYRMLLMQEMNYFMAQADYNMAIAEIEMMVGTEIKNGEF